MTHLMLIMNETSKAGAIGHPQQIMKSLGVTYQHAVPQSISDTWEFWNCENVPDDLPAFLEVKDWDPMDRIGWGLSQEKAEEIRDYKE